MRLVVSVGAAALLILLLMPWGASQAGVGIGEPAPPTTDLHTVVTEPGSGGGGGPGDVEEPHQPVCVWVRGGPSEVDTVARNAGVGGAIIREDAVDHILLVYRCDGRWDGRTWRWAIPVT